MKIAVATGKGGLDDDVSVVFGRCRTFTLVVCEGGGVKGASVVPNPSLDAAGGAGIKAAQLIAGEGAEAVIAGNFGPNAAAVLSQMGVKMVQAQGNVKKTVEKYLNNELTAVQDATVKVHFGMGGGGFGGARGRGRGGGR